MSLGSCSLHLKGRGKKGFLIFPDTKRYTSVKYLMVNVFLVIIRLNWLSTILKSGFHPVVTVFMLGFLWIVYISKVILILC